MVNIHQFGIFLGVLAPQAVDQGGGSIQSRQTGNIPFNRFAADADVVPCGNPPLGRCGNDIVDLSAFNQGKGVLLTGKGIVYLLYHLHLYPSVPQDGGCALCGVNLEAQSHKFLGNIGNFRLIRVPHRDKYPSFFIQLVARSHKPFEKGFLHGIGNPQHFPGGFHFRPKLIIQISQFFKGKHGNLYRIIRRNLV